MKTDCIGTLVITKAQCVALILREVPAFCPTWQEHLDCWGDEEAGFWNDVAAFSQFFRDVSGDLTNDGCSRIFDLIEQLMVEGDEDVRNAVATCFLENIANWVGEDDLPSGADFSYLGEESRTYFQAYINAEIIGSGSLADTIRFEMRTGRGAYGEFHYQKALHMTRRLDLWLRQNETARPGDKAAAENMHKDLVNALCGDDPSGTFGGPVDPTGRLPE
jgi:hypothetical protein